MGRLLPCARVNSGKRESHPELEILEPEVEPTSSEAVDWPSDGGSGDESPEPPDLPGAAALEVGGSEDDDKDEDDRRR